MKYSLSIANMQHMIYPSCGSGLKASCCQTTGTSNHVQNNTWGSKGLLFDTWLESVTEGRKGDILALYGISVLPEVHTIMHLRNGHIWSTLRDLLNSHTEAVKMHTVHITYIGHGLFIELSERPIPLKILPDSAEGIQSLVMSSLNLLTYPRQRS